jgi:hypothetical protein
VSLLYGVSVKITGSGLSWPAGLNTVAFSRTPSRRGTLTAQRRSISGAGAAGDVPAPSAAARAIVRTVLNFMGSR